MTTMTNAKQTHASKADSKHDRAEAAAEKAKQHASGAADAVHAVTDKVQDEVVHVAELAKDGFDQAKDMHASACERVKRNPTASILIAVGVGVILGRLFGGR